MLALQPDTVIDVHAHFVPDVYRHALAGLGLDTVDRGMSLPPWSSKLALDAMDRNGIHLALLSVSSPGLGPLAPADEAGLARAINLEAARLVSEHPGRFGALATLPVGDSAGAVAEIDYALDELGLAGFILETNHRGVYPSDPPMASVMAALERRGAMVLLHPTTPFCQHCVGTRPSPLIEFPFETTRAVTEMLYTGTFRRYPSIRFVLAHAGGTLPFLAQRIAGFAAHPASGAVAGISRAEIEHQLSRLWYDTALSTSPAQLHALRQIAGIDRILFGSDWPFSPEPVTTASLAELRNNNLFGPAELAGVLGGNASGLLNSRAGRAPADQRAV